MFRSPWLQNALYLSITEFYLFFGGTSMCCVVISVLCVHVCACAHLRRRKRSFPLPFFRVKAYLFMHSFLYSWQDHRRTTTPNPRATSGTVMADTVQSCTISLCCSSACLTSAGRWVGCSWLSGGLGSAAQSTILSQAFQDGPEQWKSFQLEKHKMIIHHSPLYLRKQNSFTHHVIQLMVSFSFIHSFPQ